MRQKEKNKDIPLVDGNGGRFDATDDATVADRRDCSVDVNPLDPV